MTQWVQRWLRADETAGTAQIARHRTTTAGDMQPCWSNRDDDSADDADGDHDTNGPVDQDDDPDDEFHHCDRPVSASL
ncbi:MAG: hypothetical protein JO057_15740 [Chloroflexi bacterium]|nr:hypothetical protein [Chloroflexota bacterium]